MENIELPEPVGWEWRKRLASESGHNWTLWEPLVAPYLHIKQLAVSNPETYEIRPVFTAEQLRETVARYAQIAAVTPP